MDKQPPRLNEDPAASATLRSDMTHARDEHRAYAAAYDWAARVAAFQAALAAGGASSMGSSSAAAAHAKLGGWVKALLGIAGASALVMSGAALHAGWQARNAQAPAIAAPAPAPGPAAEPGARPAPALPSPALPESEPKAQPSKHGAARNVVASPTASEARQLARIRAHLQAGEAARALALAERGQRELGESVLWQEREALAVLALLELQRAAQATVRARALIDRYPDSPFRAEIEQRLSGADAR